MRIIVDTREQLPLFSRDVIRRKLHVADYTTELLENIFHIERKSGADLYGSLTRGHVRFRNMLIRAERCGITVALFVECSRKDFLNKKFPGGSRCLGFPSSGLDRMIKTMEAKYKVEIVWAKTRRGCVRNVKLRLKEVESIIERTKITRRSALNKVISHFYIQSKQPFNRRLKLADSLTIQSYL